MNLRTLIICLTFLTAFNLAKAQDDNSNYGGRYQRHRQTAPQQETPSSVPTGYVSVNSGLSTVTGNWGFGVSSQYDGTYAMNGTFQNIAAGIPINGSNFGISCMLGFYDNPFDVNDFINNALNATNIPYNTYGISTSGDYETVNFMAGVFYTYPVNRFSFDVRGMVGYVSCRLPETEYDAEVQPPNVYLNPTRQDDWDIASSTARGFGYDLGVGVRYSFRRNLCVMLNADVLEASLSFSTIENQTTIDQNGNISYPPSSTITGTVPLSLFNISLGLGFLLGR